MKKIAYLLLTISFCGLTACKTGTKKGGNMDNETLVKIETTLGDIKVSCIMRRRNIVIISLSWQKTAFMKERCSTVLSKTL